MAIRLPRTPWSEMSRVQRLHRPRRQSLTAKNDYSNAESYSKAQANPSATRLVVPGVAISFGVRRQARWTPSYFRAGRNYLKGFPDSFLGVRLASVRWKDRLQ